MPYTVNGKTIENQTIADTLVAAFEGGSNYWMERVTPPFTRHADYSKPCRYGEHMIDRVIQSDDGMEGHFNHENVQRGLELMGTLEWARFHFRDMTSENGDADTGDVLLQLIVFGELVYG